MLNKTWSRIECFQCCLSTESSNSVSFFFAQNEIKERLRYFILLNISTKHFILRKVKGTLFEFSVDKQHWKHSICDKSLFNFYVFKLFFLSFLSCRPFRNWQPFNSLFSSLHHSFSGKTLNTIVQLYFFWNSPVRLLVLANDC